MMKDYIRRCCSRSLLTGIHHHTFRLSIDRRCNDLDYDVPFVILMELAWNYAKSTIKFFNSNVAFQKHRDIVHLVDCSDNEAALICLRKYVEMLIQYQCGILNIPLPACI